MGIFDSFLQGLNEGMTENVSDAQAQAVSDALFCVMFADGEANDEEHESLTQQLEAVPWFKERGRAKTKKIFDNSVATVQRLMSPAAGRRDVRRAFREIAAQLESEALRERTFRIGVALVYADGDVNDEERAVVGTFAEEFGLDEDRMTTIIDEEKANAGMA